MLKQNGAEEGPGRGGWGEEEREGGGGGGGGPAGRHLYAAAPEIAVGAGDGRVFDGSRSRTREGRSAVVGEGEGGG